MRAAVLLCLLVALLPAAGGAQLLSPGPLSAPHAELQGIRQCTACHRLGQRGAGADRCLACHEALGARVRASLGYHATVQDRACGSCHAEHYGRDFALVRLDTANFDHDVVGYRLRAAHAGVLCRDCHRAEHVRDATVRAEKQDAALLGRTFLGLSTTCIACHATEDPHGRQFGARDCAACHVETQWTDAPAFDHGSAAFTLAGAHATVECAACHAERQGVVQYTGIAHGTCTACHTDPHRPTQGGACASCHTTDGWRAFGAAFDERRFDHARTSFPLRAAHARIDCAACHRSPARMDARIRITLARVAAPTPFPPVAVRDCRSCHVPAHPGAKPGTAAGANCAACHTEEGWSPAAFGMREHAGTRFPLDGAHVLLACTRCHARPAAGRLEFRQADVRCTACHVAASPHGRAYADAAGYTDCTRCHGTGSWDASATSHDAFPLTGGHARVACASCHPPERQRAPRTCEGCHAATDPHGGRSAGRSCADCHDTGSFTATRFDHATTRYPLEGAHAGLACRACHVREADGDAPVVLRYAPLPTRCEDCHGA